MKCDRCGVPNPNPDTDTDEYGNILLVHCPNCGYVD